MLFFIFYLMIYSKARSIFNNFKRTLNKKIQNFYQIFYLTKKKIKLKKKIFYRKQINLIKFNKISRFLL